MTTPLITWGVIVALFIIILLARLLKTSLFHSKHNPKLLSLMPEREEFFIPGDPQLGNVEEYEYDDFEDL